MRLSRNEESANGRRRLRGRTERRGSHTGMSTRGIFAFGACFVVMGLFIVLVGSRVIPVDPKKVHAPWWVLTTAGAVFALGGLMVWGMTWKQFTANRRRELARKNAEPALSDYAWDTRGVEAPRWKRAFTAVGGALFLTLFLSMFNWWAFFAEGPWPVKIIVILFDLILVAVWWQAAIRVGCALKFGRSRLEFSRFPFRPGGPVVLHWTGTAEIADLTGGTFTLRCVEEWQERSGHGKSRTVRLVHEELWSGTWHLDPAGHCEPGKRLELQFDVPADAPSTCLHAERPVFWELEVNVQMPGFDFEETYLVPVYGPALSPAGRQPTAIPIDQLQQP